MDFVFRLPNITEFFSFILSLMILHTGGTTTGSTGPFIAARTGTGRLTGCSLFPALSTYGFIIFT